RSASLRQGAQPACSDAISVRLTVTSCPASFGGDTVTVTASVHIPSVIPGHDFGDASKTATMPLDH
ncbi:pilus assembly protein, partial [Streptomyces sp. W16]|nr:pilus assembly protein [Streptomyces sp. W16]